MRIVFLFCTMFCCAMSFSGNIIEVKCIECKIEDTIVIESLKTSIKEFYHCKRRREVRMISMLSYPCDGSINYTLFDEYDIDFLKNEVDCSVNSEKCDYCFTWIDGVLVVFRRNEFFKFVELKYVTINVNARNSKFIYEVGFDMYGKMLYSDKANLVVK